MAIYKWLVKLKFCYFLLLGHCTAIKYNEEWLAMADKIGQGTYCRSSCRNYKFTTIESTMWESNRTTHKFDYSP